MYEIRDKDKEFPLVLSRDSPLFMEYHLDVKYRTKQEKEKSATIGVQSHPYPPACIGNS